MTNASKSGLEAGCSLPILYVSGPGVSLTFPGARKTLREKNSNPMDQFMTQSVFDGKLWV